MNAPAQNALPVTRVNKRVKFSVAGTAGANTDQAAFFYAVADTAIDANHDLATITVKSQTRFTNAQVGTYISHRPAQVTNVHITGADSSETVSSMIIQPVRYDIDGDDLLSKIEVDSYQDARDFQTTRISIPMDYVVDGWSFLRILNDEQAGGASYTVTFALVFALDNRARVSRGAPRVTKSSAA